MPTDPTPPASDALAAACAVPTAVVDRDGRLLAVNAGFTARFQLVAGDALSAIDAVLADPGALHDALAVEGGRLHVRALDGDRWLAQLVEGPADAGAEQRQLQMFADTVAHDLRAPLRSIESFAKLLEDRAAPKLDAAERMHLSRIRAAAGRMSGLLTALGELSRAASAAMNPSDVDLSLLAEWVLAELHDADAGRDVIVDVQPGLHVRGDERLLRQLLRALLENAWTFTRGADPARIEVHGEVVDGRLRLAVRDTGCGLDMQYAHKLFQPFQRLHGVEQGAGHGLGLAIAQRIAHRHGGRVSAESTLGAGSTFTVELPVAGP
ncbi:sensor histidine kinase [Lysobacter xanthus]